MRRTQQASDPDRGMKIAGFVIAGIFAGFAVIAVSRNDGSPNVAGLRHFAIFAQPAYVRDAKLAGEIERAGVDYEPTASIRAPAKAEPSRAPVAKDPSDVKEATLKWTERDRVSFYGPNGPFFVAIGQHAPGRGTLVEIVREKGQWKPIFSPDSRD